MFFNTGKKILFPLVAVLMLLGACDPYSKEHTVDPVSYGLSEENAKAQADRLQIAAMIAACVEEVDKQLCEDELYD